MNMVEILLAAALVTAVVLAVVCVIRRRKNSKGCSCGCENCAFPCEKKKKSDLL